MDSFLNSSRPLIFCPGCSHERVTKVLDKVFVNLGLDADKIALVSDIGCSGLFDTFFNTHAFHGLHGRALTYATGLKMARPDLNVIVTMGDGGLGIGGAHLLSTCRRNINLTLLVLNNFNYGMTGGQFSSTTPADAMSGSGFLNKLEKPMDICQVAASAGAGFVTRTSVYDDNIAEEIENAIKFDGFSIIDMWGMCTGRFTKKNKLTPKTIDQSLGMLQAMKGPVKENKREEYSKHYYRIAGDLSPANKPACVDAVFEPLESKRQEIVILGSAGQRIITAGEILCLAGISQGLHATQKNDYPITVLRGHSVSELVLAKGKIGFTGITSPDIIIALADEGVKRRYKMLESLDESSLIIKSKGLELPRTKARILEIDFKAQKIKFFDMALASLSIMAQLKKVISSEMLETALSTRFKGKILESSLGLIKSVSA